MNLDITLSAFPADAFELHLSDIQSLPNRED